MSDYSKFDVTFEVDGAHFRATGQISRYRPEKTNCRNDDCRPAEGGDIEDLEVFLADEDEEVEIELPAIIADDLTDKELFDEALRKAIHEG